MCRRTIAPAKLPACAAGERCCAGVTAVRDCGASREEAAKSSNLVVLLLWAADYQRALPVCKAEAREAERVGRLNRAARAWACGAFCEAALGDIADAP